MKITTLTKAVFLWASFFFALVAPTICGACPPEGCDRGEAGWQEARDRCPGRVDTRDKALECFMVFDWISEKRSVIEKELKHGFIKIGGDELRKEWTLGAIEVFVFRRHAVGKEGVVYLLSELG